MKAEEGGEISVDDIKDEEEDEDDEGMTSSDEQMTSSNLDLMTSHAHHNVDKWRDQDQDSSSELMT